MTLSKRILTMFGAVALAMCLAVPAAFAAQPGNGATFTAAGTGAAAGQELAAARAKTKAKPEVAYRVCNKGRGWSTGWTYSGATAGARGKALQVIKIAAKKDGLTGSVAYRVKTKGSGWSGWVRSGKSAGVKGSSIVGVQVRLLGKLSKYFDVQYRVFHDQDGWLPWTVNGDTAGCRRNVALDQIQVQLVKKGTVPALKKGAYVLGTARNAKYVLAASRQEEGAGADLVRARYDVSEIGERFYVRNEGKNTISLQSVATGQFVCVSGGKVVLGPYAKDGYHRWKLKSWSNGYALANVGARKYLKLVNGKARLSSARTRWTFSNANIVGNGSYTMENGERGDLLALAELSLSDGVALALRERGAVEEGTQVFTFTHKGGNQFRIDCSATRKALEVEKGSKVNGAAVRQAKWKGTAAQKWKAKMTRANGLQLVNMASRKPLTARPDGSGGAAAVSWKNTGAASQSWALQPAEATTNTNVLRAMQKAKDMSSSTGYLIMVDLSNHWLTVFTGSQGSWKPYRDWEVSTGAPSSPTVTGSYTVGIKQYSFGHGYTCYYATQFYGNYLFHSVLYNEGTRSIQDGRLGRSISQGCVRMEIGNAKWIYDNIPEGTRVKTFW